MQMPSLRCQWGQRRKINYEENNRKQFSILSDLFDGSGEILYNHTGMEESREQHIRPQPSNHRMKFSLYNETIATVPAYFNDVQSEATKVARCIIGLFEELNMDVFSTIVTLVQYIIFTKFNYWSKHSSVTKNPFRGINSEQAVKYKAAMQAVVLSDLQDVCVCLDGKSQELGIETIGAVMIKLIQRNTDISTKKSEIFSTISDNRHTTTIQTDDKGRSMRQENHLFGKVEVTFGTDANEGAKHLHQENDFVDDECSSSRHKSFNGRRYKKRPQHGFAPGTGEGLPGRGPDLWPGAILAFKRWIRSARAQVLLLATILLRGSTGTAHVLHSVLYRVLHVAQDVLHRLRATDNVDAATCLAQVAVLMFLSAAGAVWAALTRHAGAAAAFVAKASACHRLVPFARGPFEARAYTALVLQGPRLQLVHLAPGCAAVAVALLAAGHYYPLLLAGFLLRAFGELAKFALLNAVLVVRAAADALHAAMGELYLRRLRGDKERMFTVRGNPGEPEDEVLVFQEVYLTLCEMADVLNDAFGTQMVIELLYLFVSFTWCLFMFVTTVFGNNKEDIPSAMAWSLLALGSWDMAALVALTSAVGNR
ncbi:Endoplasmic reticulum chaperone BiP [Gryllus bimaculatus]|nr:Endoplasmic reticulum chaperone BiP [Gryllus bimaculatus]